MGQICLKERLGHGKFGEWIKLEFDWSQQQANYFMKIGSEFSALNYNDSCNLPTAMKPAYALASALSKEDEEGKQEILDDYQKALAEKQEKAKACRLSKPVR